MDLLKTLQQEIEGEVRSDRMHRYIYSVDASIYEVPPKVIVLPKTRDDLIRTVDIGRHFNTPIIPRGGGTGIAGGCLGEGIVVDTTKYLNKILEVNLEEKWAICEPGVIQDQLNTHLAPHNLRLGPDTTTGNRATLGGMCATNATGAHFLKYGNMVDHVQDIELVFSDGRRRWLEGFPLPSFEGLHLPTFKRRSSGYQFSSNPAQVCVGSEGTLGLFSQIKLTLSPTLQKTSLIILPFSSLEEALGHVPEILSHNPISLELIDDLIIEMGRLSPILKHRLDWLPGDPKALLAVEFETESPPTLSSNQTLAPNPADVWALRKAGLGLLLSRRSYSRAIAFIEDLAVPPENLVPFIHELKELVGTKMGIYGHAGDGCLHIRPYVDVRHKEGIFATQEMACELVKKYGGVLSGEHGDGRIRSWLNPKLFDTSLYEAFVSIKETFDPLNLMNPGKIVHGSDPKTHLRSCNPSTVPTFLNFEKEGGLHLAADLCNGNGACRKREGLMCPSYQAFGDEYHTTRARAQGLRSLLNQQASLADKELVDVLDYCLECKGCKTECPSQVDMAKMKMEVLHQYQEKHGISLRNRLFGTFPDFAPYASKFAPLTNLILQSPFRSLIGITLKRPLPKFTQNTFSKWWASHAPLLGGKPITLFTDTFTEYHSPEIGIAAVQVLEREGYSVNVLPHTCCGRPLLSKGMLKKAHTKAHKLASLLEKQTTPIIVLEPSCLSALIDDYTYFDLKISQEIISLESLFPLDTNALIQPHCHEQALSGKTIGCCGMAGSFGYEIAHYEMSMAIGERHLFPQIRGNPDKEIIASGFSCRHQIHHGTGRKALHPAEAFFKKKFISS